MGEYCKVNPECQKGTAEYRDAKTDRCIKFNFNRVEHHQCIKDQPTPSSLDEDCKHFRMVTGITDKDMDRMDVNEFVLLSPRGDLMTSCYRMNAGKHGWCGTKANIVTGKPADAYKKDIVVSFSQEASRETPEVFINVDDMMNMPREGDHMRKVTTIILPKGAYRGGKYGDYGGYDIILIKVAQPMDPSLAACLPGQGYRPISPMIGGYGRYRRVPCETTDMGPHVYEYCKVNPECQKGTAEYRDAKTDRCIKFNFNRVEHHQCIKDQPTPSSLDEDSKHCYWQTSGCIQKGHKCEILPWVGNMWRHLYG